MFIDTKLRNQKLTWFEIRRTRETVPCDPLATAPPLPSASWIDNALALTL
jgi:hypothetical protein